MGRVDGKVALISGGARGMGAAHARALVGEGAKVVIGDILDDDGKKLADELGDAARYVHLDVTQPEEWDAAVSTAVNDFGKLNVLVNNAGIVALGQLGQFNVEKWNKVIDVNLNGTFHGIQAVVEPMKAAGGGSIINVSSIEGLRGAVMVHPYVASKWAVRGLTKSAALELASQNIRVNSIHPGFIRTPMTKHFPDDMVTVPLGRPGVSEEVATFVVFLASDESSYATGAEFVMDGGLVNDVPHRMYPLAELFDDGLGEPLDRRAVALGVLDTGPRSAHHRRDPEVFGAPVQINRRRLEQGQHDLERFALPPVFAPQRRQLLHVSDRVVPRVGGADPPVAESRGPAQRGLRFAAAQDGHRRARVRLEHQLGHLVVAAAPRHPAALPPGPERP